MKQISITLLACLLACLLNGMLFAQQYTDFIGAGHDVGVTVTTSHNQNTNDDGSKSVDGFPIDDPVLLADASRFLAQATIGYDYEMMQMAAAMGYEAWLDEQLSLPASSSCAYSTALLNFFDEEDEGDGGANFFRASWWNLALGAPDVLRQRLTYSLSQILVVSSFGNDLFEDVGLLSTGYYDVLGNNSFSNYRDLLSAVSRNPAMGIYLSHMNNPKSDPANNIHPDENYAREVMQLFSIGLYELNNDGSRKLDAEGNFIPTYNNDDIREFAKIFTGFGPGDGESWSVPFDDIAYLYGDTQMAMYEEWHEPGPKYLLNGQVVPEGQSGLEDFEAAMDNLYNHPNVGPFIGKALIQFMVSSNPSPEYIGRVASVFNNNGQGIRGDLKAVVKAILLDPEARNCSPLENPTAGKLREPMLRYSGFLKAFNTTPENGIFVDMMFRWIEQTGQAPLYASSVFNFYQPEFQPNGIIADQNLVAPVFQIHNSSTSIGYINDMFNWTFYDEPFEPLGEEGIDNATTTDYSDELMLIADATELVDRLDLLLACGQLSEGSKEIIITAVEQVEEQDDKLKMAIYLILLAPEYAILK